MKRYLLVQITNEGTSFPPKSGRSRTITNPTGKGRAFGDFSVSEFLKASKDTKTFGPKPSVQTPSVKVTNTKPKPKPYNASDAGEIYTRAGRK